MNQKRLHNGFTLVEISIVMIIIGLLISGIFGGMKLIDNANAQKTIQDIKAIESAALTFRDTYRALPGDIRNPNTRIPNCTVAPCATAGNGNRVIGTNGVTTPVDAAITNTDENFTFWHHLQAANLLQMDYRNVADLNFGEGQPSSSIGGGFRTTTENWVYFFGGIRPFSGTILYNVGESSSALPGANSFILPCNLVSSLDKKIDDGFVFDGILKGWGCSTVYTATAEYVLSNSGAFLYDLKGF